MNILFIASDNNRTSGAFLSLVKLNQILSEYFHVNTMTILPNAGDGNVLLDAMHLRYKIICSRNWIVDMEEKENTRRKEAEKEKELVGNKGAIEQIKQVIISEKIDVVHINTSYSYVGAVAAKEAGVSLIWHIREFLEEDQNRKIWDRDKGYQLMNSADRIVAISNSIYNKYAPIFGKDKMRVIFNGIDEKVYYNRDKKWIPRQKWIFTIIGGVLPYKGQTEIIKACGILKKTSIKDFELYIVGKCKDAYEKVIREHIEDAGLTEKVYLCGSRDDIPEVIEQTDILFVCSKHEAFGRTTVEGMMGGCLVVGADTAGTKELIEDGVSGYLYKQGDVKALAECIEYIRSNAELANEIRLRGQALALEKYTAKKNAEKIFRMYEDVQNNA